MSRRTMDNCRVIKAAVARGIGKPLTEEVNGKKYCQGYYEGLPCPHQPQFATKSREEGHKRLQGVEI